jgi:glycosyltransferase involved in cell wall biosynthesis
VIENYVIGMIGDYPPTLGGIATHIKELANALSTKNRVVIITSSQTSSFTSLGNIEIYRVKRLQKRHFTTVTTILSLMKKANTFKNRVNLFHVHSFPCGGIGLINRTHPLILTVHGYTSLEMVTSGRIKMNSIGFKAARKFEQMMVRRADAIIAVDSTIENWLKKDLKADESKVYCIPNGVNVQQFSPDVDGSEIRIKYRVKDNERLIVAIRKFTPKNGVETILEGFNLLKKIYGFENIRLLLGGGGELKEKFVKMILENKLENSVILEDAIPHKEVPKYFAAADIIINSSAHISGVEEFEVSSLFEALEKARPIGTSITTVEALSSGKATIVSTQGGKFKGLDPNDVGVLTPDNAEILADALARLLKNEKLLETFGRNGREYIIKKRAWNVIAERTSEVYQAAISRR